MSDPSTPPLVHTSTPAPPSHRSSSSPRSRPASIASTASKASWPDRFRTAGTTLVTHATKHTGVGLVCAVAYFDPGNWGVDLQAGSEFGYRLLFIVLLAGLLAVYWQVMASRLGVVTGLGEQCERV
jgi:metal iron transporter